MENVTSSEHYFWELKGKDDNVDKWFLMSSPIPVASIWLTYITFVLKVGPAFMKNRPPFALNNVLLIYNAVQVIISCIMTSMGSSFIYNNGLFMQRTCESDNANFRNNITNLIYYYFLAKVTELLDTIFFVLRKKDNQVTFLHVYHHSITMIVSWIAVKYEPSYCIIFLGTLNSFVHVVMYSYYGLATFPDLVKYLWWKKYITAMQMVQFLTLTFQVTISYKLSPCRPSYMFIGVIIFHLLLFMYLFSDFYIKSYIKNNNKHLANSKDKSYYKNGSNITEKTEIVNNNKINYLIQRKKPKEIYDFKNC